MSVEEVGCCGAYCATCRAYKDKTCKGCKIGYSSGERDIRRAKCKIKRCCIAKGYNSCADCAEFSGCEIVGAFHSKPSYKYHKYEQALQFIRDNGYDKFVEIADTWKNAYGKYE